MTKDDEATFAVRLGDGKADFNVFEGKNIVIVGGERITTATQEALIGKTISIIGTVFMVLAAIIVLCALIGIVIFCKKDNKN